MHYETAHDFVGLKTRKSFSLPERQGGKNEQSENISASNTALDIYFKLTGAYAPEKKTNLNINSDFEDPNNRVKELLIELRRIGELNNNLLDELKNIP